MQLYRAGTQRRPIERTGPDLPNAPLRLPRRKQSPPPQNRKPRSPDERVPPMYRDYLSGATLAEAGKPFDLTRERVRQLFRDAGLPTRDHDQASRMHALRQGQKSPRDQASDQRGGAKQSAARARRARALDATPRPGI